MSLNQAIEVLKKYNDWRIGKTNEMIPPIIITHAIEIIIKHYERQQSK